MMAVICVKKSCFIDQKQLNIFGNSWKSGALRKEDDRIVRDGNRRVPVFWIPPRRSRSNWWFEKLGIIEPISHFISFYPSKNIAKLHVWTWQNSATRPNKLLSVAAALMLRKGPCQKGSCGNPQQPAGKRVQMCALENRTRRRGEKTRGGNEFRCSAKHFFHSLILKDEKLITLHALLPRH